MTIVTGTVHEDQYTIILISMFLEMFHTIVVEKIKNTHFMFNNFLPKIVPFVR